MLLPHTLLASCAFAAGFEGAASGSQGYATGGVASPPPTGADSDSDDPNAAAQDPPPPYLTVNDFAGNPVLKLALAAEQDDPEAQRSEIWERWEEIGERLRAAVPDAGPASYEEFCLVTLPVVEDPRIAPSAPSSAELEGSDSEEGAFVLAEGSDSEESTTEDSRPRRDAMLLQPTENGPEAMLYRSVFPSATQEDLYELANLLRRNAPVEVIEKFVRERNDWALVLAIDRLSAMTVYLTVCCWPGAFLRRHDAREIFAAADITKRADTLRYTLEHVRSEAEVRQLFALADWTTREDLNPGMIKKVVDKHRSNFHRSGRLDERLRIAGDEGLRIASVILELTS